MIIGKILFLILSLPSSVYPISIVVYGPDLADAKKLLDILRRSDIL